MPTVRHTLETFINGVWYRHQHPWLLMALKPLEYLYAYLARANWNQYAAQRSEPLPCKVVVVGNIVAGGSGKTPVTQALALALRAKGLRVGIVSRGYGGTSTHTSLVDPSNPTLFGDEPCLLAASTACPVMVGKDRREAVVLLCSIYPLDIVLSDDGMQHAGLHRDFELCVLGTQGLGNGRGLPAGPLREPLQRLATVGAVVTWQSSIQYLDSLHLPATVSYWQITGQQGALQHLDGTPAQEGSVQQLAALQKSKKLTLYAAAGIARPERFYQGLQAAGLSIQPLWVADHGALSVQQLNSMPPTALLLVTEKDAIKLRYQPHETQLAHTLIARIRVVPWRVTLPDELIDTMSALV